MPAGFESEGKMLVADLSRGLSREAEPFTRANEKFHLSPAYRCGGFNGDDIKIVEGAAK